MNVPTYIWPEYIVIFLDEELKMEVSYLDPATFNNVIDLV